MDSEFGTCGKRNHGQAHDHQTPSWLRWRVGMRAGQECFENEYKSTHKKSSWDICEGSDNLVSRRAFGHVYLVSTPNSGVSGRFLPPPHPCFAWEGRNSLCAWTCSEFFLLPLAKYMHMCMYMYVMLCMYVNMCMYVISA